MLALRELQLRFAAALIDGAVEPVQSEIVANGVAVAERIDIYRNNVREGFAKALGIGFPVIEKLVGTHYFRQLAGDFQRVHPSRSGNLQHIGAPFPAFLRERFSETEYAYLADVAALEHACEKALIAPDAQAISTDSLRDIDPASYELLRFDLHPACGLVRSAYPIVRIWRANQPDASDGEIIDLRAGGNSVLVMRTPGGCEFLLLPAGEFSLLDAFARELPLGAAFEAAQEADPAFDLQAALHRFFSLNIFVGLRPAAELP